MKNNLFSIIIPVYNTEKLVYRAVMSVLKQKYKNFEVICVNDGSTDNSLQVLNDLKKHDARVNVIDIKNAGPSNARNLGIKHAKGDYIIFVDSDDYMEHNALKLINEKICNNNFPNLLVFSSNVFNTDEVPGWLESSLTSRNIVRSGEDCFASLFEESSAIPFITNKVYKTSFIKSNNILFPTNIKLGEDSAFLHKVFASLDTVYFFSDVIYNYGWQRQDSLMSVIKKDKFVATQHHLKLFENNLLTLYQNDKLKIRTNQFMQSMISLLYNTHLNELPKEQAYEISDKFVKLLEFYNKVYNLNNLYDVYSWDHINISDLSCIDYINSCQEKHTIDFVVYEHSSFDLHHLYQFLEKQKKIDYRIVINCFSFDFYKFIKSLNIANSVVLFLPCKSFSDAKNMTWKYSSSKYVLYLNHLNHLNTNICLDEMIDTLNKNLSYVALTMNPKANKKLVKQDDNCELLDLGSTIFRTSKLQDFEDFKEDTPCCDSIFMLENLAHKKVLIAQQNIYDCLIQDKYDIISNNRNYSNRDLIISLGKLAMAAIDHKFDHICKLIMDIIKFPNLINIVENVDITIDNAHYYYEMIFLYPLVEYLAPKDKSVVPYKNYLASVVEQLEILDEELSDQIIKSTIELDFYSNPKVENKVKQIKNSKIYKWWRRKKYGK